MTEQTTVFLIAVSLMFSILLTTGAVYLRRANKLSREGSLDALLARLVLVDRHKLAQIVADLEGASETEDFDEPYARHPAGDPLEPWQLWELAGGIEGLEAMAANCEVLIDLACYVQEWYPEALPVAEELRLNAREIQWHLGRLRGAQSRGHLQSAFPEYAQRAVATYYGMTQHVLALYEASGVPGWTRLQAAL